MHNDLEQYEGRVTPTCSTLTFLVYLYSLPLAAPSGITVAWPEVVDALSSVTDDHNEIEFHWPEMSILVKVMNKIFD